ncbi:MAG: ATP-binding cassette domain-containing protein [Oscillospiraceae bacterium]|nr:ATP-binding cassette domain-containing protein [Oscillospiraceae bacterium]
MAIFEIKNLNFSYPQTEKQVLKNINLTVNEGEFLLIFGKSGSGKTTLLNHFKTVMTPHGKRDGQIIYDGRPLADVSDRVQAAEIGYVLQNPDRQLVTDKVWHELAFGLENTGIEQSEMHRRVAETANFFGIDKWYDRDVSTLSGGQKQLLNLACVMVMQPKVLILDEPTSQLDPIAATDFLNAVYRINSELGTTVIIIEQRTESAFSQADRVVFMADGEIVSVNRPEKIFEDISKLDADTVKLLPTPMQVFYGLKQKGAAPVSIKKGRNWLLDYISENNISVTEYKREKPAVAGRTAIQLKDVWYRYEKDGEDVLKGADIAIPQGCLYAIIGGNGSGKSTLIKTICGINRPYMGKVIVDKSLGKAAYLPQEATLLFSRETVLEELQEMTADKNLIAETAALCNINGLLDSHPYDISAGQQQCVALAKVLLSGAEILLLDEVTKGMDGIFKSQLADLLKKLCEKGKTIVIVSHDIEFCSEYADMVGMFFNGTIVSQDVPQRFFAQNSFYTTAGARMSKGILKNTVNAKDIIYLCKAETK